MAARRKTKGEPSSEPDIPELPELPSRLPSPRCADASLEHVPTVPSPRTRRLRIKHPLDAPESSVSQRARGVKTDLSVADPGVWVCTGGYKFQEFQPRYAPEASVHEPLEGDKRLRQLHQLSCGSPTRTRVVEPSAHEMRIVKARRKPHVISSSGFAGNGSSRRRLVELALSLAREALEDGLCIETGLAKNLEERYDQVYGPKWKCFVGMTCSFAVGGVSANPNDPHVYFRVGQLPFLLFQEQHHSMLGTRHEVKEAELTMAQIADTNLALGGGQYVSQKLHVVHSPLMRPGDM